MDDVEIAPAGGTAGAVLAICRSQLCLSRLAEASSLQAAMNDTYTQHLRSGWKVYMYDLEGEIKYS